MNELPQKSFFMMAKKSARTKQESVADEGLRYQSSNHRIKAFELTGSGNFILVLHVNHNSDSDEAWRLGKSPW